MTLGFDTLTVDGTTYEVIIRYSLADLEDEMPGIVCSLRKARVRAVLALALPNEKPVFEAFEMANGIIKLTGVKTTV